MHTFTMRRLMRAAARAGSLVLIGGWSLAVPAQSIGVTPVAPGSAQLPTGASAARGAQAGATPASGARAPSGDRAPGRSGGKRRGSHGASPQGASGAGN